MEPDADDCFTDDSTVLDIGPKSDVCVHERGGHVCVIGA